MKTTRLTEKHIALGAKMHEFTGYNMPNEYSGIIDEHLTVCNAVGVFDVSHLSLIHIYMRRMRKDMAGMSRESAIAATIPVFWEQILERKMCIRDRNS